MKSEISEKHIEATVGKTIQFVFTIFGNFQGSLSGVINGRLRNRFKQYVFTPTFPFMQFYFSIGDVEKIEVMENGSTIITVNRVEPPKKRKRRKKKVLPVVAAEPDMVVDLTVPQISAEKATESYLGTVI